MKKSTNEVPHIGEEWDFWFSHTKHLPKSSTLNKNESYYFIYNCQIDEVDYISDAVFDVLGFTPSQITVEKAFQQIHPEDLAYCKSCEQEVINISNKLRYKEHYQYSYQYSYRVRTSEDCYITILQHYQTLEIDDDGHMLKTLVLHQRIADFSERPADDFKVFDKLKNRPVNISNRYNLTKREVEILNLAQKGYKTNEIAELLFLSIHTVNTHRKNILNKTKTSSIIDLMNKYRL